MKVVALVLHLISSAPRDRHRLQILQPGGLAEPVDLGSPPSCGDAIARKKWPLLRGAAPSISSISTRLISPWRDGIETCRRAFEEGSRCLLIRIKAETLFRLLS